MNSTTDPILHDPSLARHSMLSLAPNLSLEMPDVLTNVSPEPIPVTPSQGHSIRPQVPAQPVPGSPTLGHSLVVPCFSLSLQL